MLKQVNIKREYLLIVASILILLLAYQLAFKKTIEAWKLHSDLKKQVTRSADAGYQPGYLERKNANLDQILQLYKADTNNYRSNVLSNISSIAERENVKLSQVPLQDAAYHTSQFVIQKLSFEGDYFSLIRTLDRLQSTRQIGVLRCVDMKTINLRLADDDKKKIVMEAYLEVSK